MEVLGVDLQEQKHHAFYEKFQKNNLNNIIAIMHTAVMGATCATRATEGPRIHGGRHNLFFGKSG